MQNLRITHLCLCKAITNEDCLMCSTWMDNLQEDFPSCDPNCPIAKGNPVAYRKSIKVSNKKQDKFVTFTRPSNTIEDYNALIKVVKYLKKSKVIERIEYAFEHQKNGNPHLHSLIVFKAGHYYRDISRSLLKCNNGGYIDCQDRKGTIDDCIKYLSKDIKNLDKNIFLAYNIEPYTQIVGLYKDVLQEEDKGLQAEDTLQ